MFHTDLRGMIPDTAMAGVGQGERAISSAKVAADIPMTEQRDSLARRAMDIGVVILMLPLILPVLAILAVIIKSEDPKAPVFFRQTRYGLGGKPFKIIKLRTMVRDAEALKARLADLSVEVGPGFKIPEDPRITRSGRWLRKTYLDELPQMFNVLAGDMALVGPRANSYSPDTYEPWQRLRLNVRPGITGTWQVATEKPTGFADRCRMDIDYIRQRSLMFDVSILFRTVSICMVRRSGQ